MTFRNLLYKDRRWRITIITSLAELTGHLYLLQTLFVRLVFAVIHLICLFMLEVTHVAAVRHFTAKHMASYSSSSSKGRRFLSSPQSHNKVQLIRKLNEASREWAGVLFYVGLPSIAHIDILISFYSSVFVKKGGEKIITSCVWCQSKRQQVGEVHLNLSPPLLPVLWTKENAKVKAIIMQIHAEFMQSYGETQLQQWCNWVK